MTRTVSRRGLLRAGAVAGGTLVFGTRLLGQPAAAPRARVGAGPYGTPAVDTATGLRLPKGFTAREVARGGRHVGRTGYAWHRFTDGQACFAAHDGGWILVSNSETEPALGAGCSALRFDRRGRVVDAYRTLSGSARNCAGGATPWGTWLSCEEREGGGVWEVDPTREHARPRAALGTFAHEAACVDPREERLYLTEDQPDGHLYCFVPSAWPDLSAGTLFAAVVDGRTRRVTWKPVRAAHARKDAAALGATRFGGGEGIWWHDGHVTFTTKHDNRVWDYDCRASAIRVRYSAADLGASAPLRGVDNVCVTAGGDLYVCEDGDDLDLCLITPSGVVSRFLTATGPQHAGSELTGVTFDPSGRRMYLGSQRAHGLGAVYEITGPFRRPAAPRRPPEFAAERDHGQHEASARDLLRVRVRGVAGTASLAGAGLGVRLSLREPCVVQTTLRTSRAVVAEHRFPTAVTGLTALRLRARRAAPGGHEIVVRARPTAGGGAAEVRLPLRLV